MRNAQRKEQQTVLSETNGMNEFPGHKRKYENRVIFQRKYVATEMKKKLAEGNFELKRFYFSEFDIIQLLSLRYPIFMIYN